MNNELIYEGHPIRLTGEMLSLTDMWKAAGADAARQPSNWLNSSDGSQFIEAVLQILNPRDSGIIQTKKGKGGGTIAHWQIGLAYAKYLSPEFLQ